MTHNAHLITHNHEHNHNHRLAVYTLWSNLADTKREKFIYVWKRRTVQVRLTVLTAWLVQDAHPRESCQIPAACPRTNQMGSKNARLGLAADCRFFSLATIWGSWQELYLQWRATMHCRRRFIFNKKNANWIPFARWLNRPGRLFDSRWLLSLNTKIKS